MNEKALDTDRRRNHDEDMRAPDAGDGPPRPATEPAGAENSSRSKKTKTDPATGEPTKPD